MTRVDPDFTLAGLVRRLARERPDREAFVYDETRLTFAAVHERSSRLAGALVGAGVAPGARVGVLMRNRPEFYEVAFACSKAAAIAVGLNWRLAPAELADILADCEPRVLVVDAESAAVVPPEAERPADLRIINVGEDYEALLESESAEDPGVACGPEDTVLQFYSSGTTGRPKGVMLSNRNLSYCAPMGSELYGMTGESTNMVVSPLFHIGGAGYGLTGVTQGGRTVIMGVAAADAIVATIERERVSHTFVVPAVIQTMVDRMAASPVDVSSLELISYGAAPMTEALLRRAMQAFGCGFQGVYGMTETAGTVSALPPADHEPDGPRSRLLRSVGKPLSWLEIRIADPSTGEERPAGEVGEIWVRAGQNMQGYWRQPDTTARTVTEDGWLRTGDGAYRDEEGYLFLKDRMKDMIISGGENVYPAEVENVLADHPAVNDVAVIGVPHERWGETVKAVVVLREGTQAGPEELKEFARSRLARYKCPTSIEYLDELPRNATGKVLKHVLRDMYVSGAELQAR